MRPTTPTSWRCQWMGVWLLSVNIAVVGDTRRTSMERFASTSRGRPLLKSSSGRGRLALSNNLAQTVLGALGLTMLLGDVNLVNRIQVLTFVLAVWAWQMWWPQAWLSRFLFGPGEWLRRVARYRGWQSLRRPERSQRAT